MQKIFQLLILIFLLGFINACSVGKKYQRPTVKLPQQFDNTAQSDSSIAAYEWRNFFKDTHFKID